MARGKAEDAGGLTPAKDDNAAPYHFDPRTLPIFKCVDYISQKSGAAAFLTCGEAYAPFPSLTVFVIPMDSRPAGQPAGNRSLPVSMPPGNRRNRPEPPPGGKHGQWCPRGGCRW